jgi:HAD superfamily hydrolase (TIGR01509 family)
VSEGRTRAPTTRRRAEPLGAVVFDFDGLILDTEWVIYETAAVAFAQLGHDLALEDWCAIVGLAEGDGGWYDQLCLRLGIDLARADYDAAYLAQDRSNRDHLQPLPGVVALLEEVVAAGVPAAIASSSDRAWIERHLGRLGLLSRFDAIAGVDLVGGVGKPAPDVYLAACAELDVEPARAVALEDSTHGIDAARAAGLAVVAVPNRITRHSSLDHADRVVDSLEEVGLADLRDLVDPR